MAGEDCGAVEPQGNPGTGTLLSFPRIAVLRRSVLGGSTTVAVDDRGGAPLPAVAVACRAALAPALGDGAAFPAIPVVATIVVPGWGSGHDGVLVVGATRTRSTRLSRVHRRAAAERDSRAVLLRGCSDTLGPVDKRCARMQRHP